MASSKKNRSMPLPGLVIPGSFVVPDVPVAATVNIAPAAAAKLGAEAGDKSATGAAAENGLPGWQSLGKDHKPTHINGKQGRREKKVRW
ncbi:hypothetical protein ABIB35_003309 [Arthrobacter sp. UYP6]|uniref:hypothetical protein n=1 Tax=Arthrobacter sp. UYP6 TaxID=1756378 RepID=UPI003391355A